ncbi:MAG: hypothetical protein CNC06_03180 [Pelagibacterales bacterium MED-G40]|nr:MAG: hypothetical protein CNC06_03180 [Pelagibacterales bacterium MED-G40]|tara:strand:+ start:1222 stop:2421 length:1200 start_codon:yes stop_codon:yes gene_type:complete
MEINQPYLFVEINDKNFNFLVVKYDENFDFKIIYSETIKSEGISNGKVVDALIISKIIKENLNLIENKINFTFKSATIISDQNTYKCINVSGYKNLSGSQITDDDISFILNDIKKIISDNQPNKTLIHLFNSKFVLDKNNIEKIPIGLYGEFYNQHLTFFLLPKNDLKNLKLIFNNCHINIERVVYKNFAEGINLINKNSISKSVGIININKKRSKISIFKNLSFVYSEDYSFGSDIIMSDVEKVCSLNIDIVKNIFKNMSFENLNEKENDYLDENFFQGNKFRKISLSHLNEVISARIEEIINLIFMKNINLKYLKNENIDVYLFFEDVNMFKNFKKSFAKKFSENQRVFIENLNQDENLGACIGSAELMGKGWEREAIPIIQTKKSIISRIFNTIFG